MDDEAASRAVNAEPWEPLPGHGEAPVPGVPLLVRASRSGLRARRRRFARTARRSGRAHERRCAAGGDDVGAAKATWNAAPFTPVSP